MGVSMHMGHDPTKASAKAHGSEDLCQKYLEVEAGVKFKPVMSS